MRWPSSFLDQIRAALPVVDVVKRHHKLRKDGASEWRAVTDQSLTVNTSKNLCGGVDHLMVGDAVDYDLPFKVYGHYDLRHCERTQERQY